MTSMVCFKFQLLFAFPSLQYTASFSWFNFGISVSVSRHLLCFTFVTYSHCNSCLTLFSCSYKLSICSFFFRDHFASVYTTVLINGVLKIQWHLFYTAFIDWIFWNVFSVFRSTQITQTQAIRLIQTVTTGYPQLMRCARSTDVDPHSRIQRIVAATDECYAESHL